MKKFVAMSFIIGSFLGSCSTERELEADKSQNLEKSLSGRGERACEIFENAAESTMVSGVKAVNFDNGISTTCDNNILIFPTLQSYADALVKLDQLIEDHNDSFDQQTANMTDVQADDYADAIGFDENEPLIKFEDELKFCSLRKEIEALDAAWLAQQTDGSWNISAAPDDHFIDDETERTLLSLGSEFIVGDCKAGYTLYKRYDWGFITLPIDDPALVTEILTNLNNIPGTNPTQAQVQAITDPYRPLILISVNATSPSSSQQTICRGDVKDKGEHVFGSDRRIMWKHKLKDAHFPNTPGNTLMKTYTRSFRKKNGKWKTYRATISTGFYGQIATPYQCTNIGTEPLNIKEKRRKKLKQREFLIVDAAVKQNVFFSVHKQEGNSYQNEVY